MSNELQASPRVTSFSEAIEKLVGAIANMGNVVGRVLADGKISGTEYIDLLFAAPQFQQVIQYGPQAAKDWNVLGDDERQGVIDFFSQKFDIPADVLEAKIEVTLRQAGVIYSATDRQIKAVKVLVATWKKATPATPLAAKAKK